MADETSPPRKRGKYKRWLVDSTVEIPRTTKWRMATRHTQSLEINKRSREIESEQPETIPMSMTDSMVEPDVDDLVEADFTNFNLADLMDRSLEFEVDLECPDLDDESSESDLDELIHDYDYEDPESEPDQVENEIERPDDNADEQTGDNVPLYKDATVTKFAAHAIVHLFAMEHKLSNQALSDLIRLINVLLPKGHKFASSTYMLKKYFVGRFQEALPIKHKYCGSCLELLPSSSGTGTNDVCKNKTCQELDCPAEEFLEIDLCSQLARLYKGIVNII